MTTLSDRLRPAGSKAGTAELMACLTLVAPTGMTVEDRKAWVAVAKATLTGIPADLLSRGCKRARETCRFASGIVPTIIETVQADWEARKRGHANEARTAPRLAEPEYVDPLEIRKLIQSLDLSAKGD